MTLENQVVSLELSKKLKELGVRQESLFFRVKTLAADGWFYRMWNEKMLAEVESVSAFTVAELGEMLPFELGSRFLSIHEDVRGGWDIYYEKNSLGAIVSILQMEVIWGDTLADALAKMLIYLLENNLITI